VKVIMQSLLMVPGFIEQIRGPGNRAALTTGKKNLKIEGL
jgi:hypothetical protein